MAGGRFEGTAVIDRPIDEVFAFLANGENDKLFSPRVLEIRKTTEGPIGVGTRFASTVKDAGLKSKREFELTAYEPPNKIRWTERSSNMVYVTEGGYDLAVEGTGTQVTIFNELAGKGFGKLIVGFALSQARKGADDMAHAIKQAIESR